MFFADFFVGSGIPETQKKEKVKKDAPEESQGRG
jgi:hypothetical protein